MNRLTLEEKKRANKIRCKLLYTIDKDIRETKKNNQKHFLINSMTPQEIEDKFLLFPNYKMKISTTFTKIANKYMVMETVDNRLKQNFYYTDYLQDLKKVNHSIVKIGRKRTSANNIIKIKYLVDTQEIQSPLPEIFTNKMNIGDKKLIQPDNKNSDINMQFSLNGKNNTNHRNSNNINNTEKKNKNRKSKKNNDDDSINSLTYELIQKKANLFSASLNNKNKKELKRRKNQLEAIRQLRLFCFKNLRNKRRCITKSSHQNLIYINKKFEDEDEKNNTSYSTRKIKNNNKNRNNNTKVSRNKNSKNNSKKKYDTLNESRRRKNTSKKVKDKKKIDIQNISGRRLFKHNSSKKSPLKVKRFMYERRSLVINNRVLSGKIEADILKFKKRKKEKNEDKSNDGLDEDILSKLNNVKMRKKKTCILKDSFKEKKNLMFLTKPKVKTKSNIVMFNDINNSTKRNSSENNFFNRKYKNKKNLLSSRSLVKPIIKFKFQRKCSYCNSTKKRRYSIPNNRYEKNNKKEQNSEKSIRQHSNKKNHNLDLTKSGSKYEKKENTNNKLKDKKNVNYIGKVKINEEMYKVEEEDY